MPRTHFHTCIKRLISCIRVPLRRQEYAQEYMYNELDEGVVDGDEEMQQ